MPHLDVSAFSKDCNLIEEINSILSRAMELLNVENSSNIDRLENSSSSQFGVNLEHFPIKMCMMQ